MTDKELIRSLKRLAVVEDPAYRCIGCGHEHNCSIHGCQILKAAAERLRALTGVQMEVPPLMEDDSFVPGLITEVEP